jgi:uncharacterized membrane protein
MIPEQSYPSTSAKGRGAIASVRVGEESSRESRLSPERIFLAIGLAAGLLTILLTPPFEGADEPAHWRRAYQVSEGQILAEKHDGGAGGFLPPSIRLRRPAEGERVFVDFRNTAVYSPVPYLPHALAIALGRAVDLQPVPLLYLARLVGLAAALGLGFLAIRVTPIGKRVFLLLALAPMPIRQMSMVSADSVTNAACLVFLAMFLRLSLVPTSSPARSSTGALTSSVLVVSLSKVAYFPLSFLYFLIPRAQLGSQRRQAIGFLVLAGVGAVASVAWFWLVRDLYVVQSIAPTADPGRQAAFILAHPLRYAGVLLGDLHHNGERYLRNCLGYSGRLSRPLVFLHLAAAALVALVDGRKDVALDRNGRALIVFTFACVYVLVNTLNYLGWNPVGAASIRFVQGRYFIPIGPLPFLLLTNRRFAGLVPGRRLTALSGCLAASVAAVGVRALVVRWGGG